VVVMLVLAGSAFAKSGIQSKYDKFKDVSTVQSRTQKWALGKLGILGWGRSISNTSAPDRPRTAKLGESPSPSPGAAQGGFSCTAPKKSSS
jgi:hypothetical protein